MGGEREVQDGLSTLAKRGRDVDIHTVAAGPLPGVVAGYNDPLIKQLKTGHSGFIMRPLDASEQNPLGLRMRTGEIKGMVPGRGYIVRNGAGEILQVATAGDDARAADRVDRLRQRWMDTNEKNPGF